MHRWHHVKGKAGHMVGHPEQGDARRFVGKQRKPQEAVDALIARGGLSLADLYDDVEELVRDDGAQHIAQAIARGELERLAPPVTAATHAHARAQLKTPPAKTAPAAQPTKKGDQ